MVTYGTTAIPHDEITVESGDTVQVSIAFTASVGVVGSMDTSTGTATPGDVTEVKSTRDARNKFGDGSELHRAVEQIYTNGASTVWAVPLPETSNTESNVTTNTGTLAQSPVFDPRVTSHEISVVDNGDGGASETVNITYESPPAQASSGEFNVNPITGEWEDDGAVSPDYDITYDYSTNAEWTDALTTVADKDIRILVALTEDESRHGDAADEANSRAENFDFFQVVSNVTPEESAADYSDALDEARLNLVAPARGYAGSNQTEEVRTAATHGGKLAGKTLGDSTTYESVSGLTELVQKFTTSQLSSWIDEDVTPLKDGNTIKVIKDRTTSTDSRFERSFAMEIVDEATEASHLIAQNYVGELNTEDNRDALADNHRNFYKGMEENTPTLLDGFTVAVSEDSTNANEVDVDIGLDVVNVIDTIDVTITVGDVITQG